jgi:hypothetical protein
LKLLEQGWVGGQALVTRTTADRREAVIIFRGEKQELPAFISTLNPMASEDDAPFFTTAGVQVLRGAQDIASLVAMVARFAGSRTDFAQVYREGNDTDSGWSLVVESDGTNLWWGPRAGTWECAQGELLAVPVVIDSSEQPLLLMAHAALAHNEKKTLKKLADEAAQTFSMLAQREYDNSRLFLAWRSLQRSQRTRMLEGLIGQSHSERAASAKALARYGVDLFGYVADLPPHRRASLRQEIEEMVTFREWWSENVMHEMWPPYQSTVRHKIR